MQKESPAMQKESSSSINKKVHLRENSHSGKKRSSNAEKPSTENAPSKLCSITSKNDKNE